MITVRRSVDRRYEQRRRQQIWLTFYPYGPSDPLAGGFKALESLSENRVGPGAIVPRQRHGDTEVITYVREGRLLHDDSMGRSCLIHAGQFQRMTVGPGVEHSETNVSRTNDAHVFQIWLRPVDAGVESSRNHRHFTVAERRGRMCVVASPDVRSGSLRISQDAVICSAMLDPGQHVVYELFPGRSAWLHIVHGETTLGGVVLATGDGAGVTAEAVSLTARKETELLFIDVAEQPPIPEPQDTP